MPCPVSLPLLPGLCPAWSQGREMSEQKKRLAGIATMTSGLPFGRTEVLRSCMETLPANRYVTPFLIAWKRDASKEEGRGSSRRVRKCPLPSVKPTLDCFQVSTKETSVGRDGVENLFPKRIDTYRGLNRIPCMCSPMSVRCPSSS